MHSHNNAIGAPIDRIDGGLKVTGRAAYAAEFPMEGMLYGFPVQSAIAAGAVLSIRTNEAEQLPGVVRIITHLNALKLAPREPVTAANRMTRSSTVLQTTRIHAIGQFIALVLAESYEQARYAARMVKVQYRREEPKISFAANRKRAYKPPLINAGYATDTAWGDLQRGMTEAARRVDETYETPIEHHHPMEPHATMARFNGDELLVHDSTQMLSACRDAIATSFGLPKEKITVLAPFIGGGFGSKLQPQAHVILAVMAARMTGRPVRIVITRQMMQTNTGLRQMNHQRFRLGAAPDGKLTALGHEILTHTSVDEEFVEQSGVISRMMYAVPNSLVTHRVYTTNIQVPRWTRAPGEAPGSFALESAMDELALKLEMDPVELRLVNEPAVNPENGKPWASRSLRECIRHGAEQFGWAQRNRVPGGRPAGHWLVGHGMAAASRGAPYKACSCRLTTRLSDGAAHAVVEMAATDIGTGTYTIIAQVVAERLGIEPQLVDVRIGDSSLPETPGSGGSWGAGSYSNAAALAAEEMLRELRERSNGSAAPVPEMLAGLADKEHMVLVTQKPADNLDDHAHFSFASHFVEVRVDALLGMVRVPRVVTTVAAGTILNQKTARSQIIGGVVWGIGQALMEESKLDDRYGNYVTRTLADYHVPVNLDIGRIDVHFLPEEDRLVNKLGVKGIGELGITSVAAAVTNAIFNATGKRIRQLPVTPDKLL